MAKKSRYSPSAKKRRAASAPVPQKSNPFVWVAAVLEGCQDIALEEMGRRLRQACVPLTHRRRDEIHFRFAGEVDILLDLRTVQSLFLRRDFSVQRPRTLLSPEHVNALVDLIREACAIGLNPPRQGLRIDAAGAGSPTMRRLGQTLAEKVSMPFAPEDGEVNIGVYDVLGNLVKELTNETYTAGMYKLQFNSEDIAAGTYFVRMSARGFSVANTINIIK